MRRRPDDDRSILETFAHLDLTAGQRRTVEHMEEAAFLFHHAKSPQLRARATRELREDWKELRGPQHLDDLKAKMILDGLGISLKPRKSKSRAPML